VTKDYEQRMIFDVGKLTLKIRYLMIEMIDGSYA
jgi:hypothetical protein